MRFSMKSTISLTIAVLACVAVFLSGGDSALADGSYANATFTPSYSSPVTTLTAPGTAVFTSNNIGTMDIQVSGTYTGLVGTVQVSGTRVGTPVWTNVTCDTIGGTPNTTVSANGLYRCNVAGAAQTRVNITAIASGSVVVAASGTGGNGLVATVPRVRSTYSAAIGALTPAASATDFLTVTGAAGVTVSIDRAYCTGTSTTSAVDTIYGLVRSTANATGTSTTLTNVPLNSNNAAGAATVRAYTANPGTLGTLVGNAYVNQLPLPSAASAASAIPGSAVVAGQLLFEQPITLAGSGQVFALNNNAASFPTGASISCSVQWTEE